MDIPKEERTRMIKGQKGKVESIKEAENIELTI